MKMVMGKVLACLMVVSPGIATAAAQGAFMVKDGKPNAQIVISAEDRPRMTTLAALELRYVIEKMTGARLPILTAPDANIPVTIYVGRSPETDKLGIKTDDLKKDGSYRIASGPNWLALIGRDDNRISPKLTEPKSRADRERAVAEWDRMVKASGKSQYGWGPPGGSAFKGCWAPEDFEAVFTKKYGEDSIPLWMGAGNDLKGFWRDDNIGSLNAVCGFLRGQGVRLFMPGEIGEVIPKSANLALPDINTTVNPDFQVRDWQWSLWNAFSFDDVLWERRLGRNKEIGFGHGNGLSLVHMKKEMKEAHPEYYALISGKRDTEHRGHGTPCLSSEGLENETVNFLRFQFEDLDMPAATIWPGDGLKVCQCEKCEGKSASELVWGFADRVARKLHKIHPDRIITCGAYANYWEAPGSIRRLSPNLVVHVANSGRPRMLSEAHWNRYANNVKKFREKLGSANFARGENSLYHTQKDIHYPVIYPRATDRDIKFMKEIGFIGDGGEQSQSNGAWSHIGLDHLTSYVKFSLLWDSSQDVDAILDDYCEKFYGPAAKQMKEVVDYAEANMNYADDARGKSKGEPQKVSLETALKLRDLLDAAKAAAGDGIYAERVNKVISELTPRETLIAHYEKRENDMADARKSAAVALGIEGSQLDKAKSYRLQSNVKNQEATAETSFKAGWEKNSLVLEILCKEPKMENLLASPDVHSGDTLTVFFETPAHSYYKIQINPDGKLLEGSPNPGWRSLAEVKTEKGSDFWKVRLEIPTVSEEEADADPMHRMAGAKPTAAAPWFFNIFRQRSLGEGKKEVQAFSPSDRKWEDIQKFGRLEIE